MRPHVLPGGTCAFIHRKVRGHTFCRQCAVRWFSEPRKLCPAARCPASAKSKPTQLPTAYVLKGMVDDLRVYCRYGLRVDEGRWTTDPEGCQAHLLREEAAAHEASCAHAFEVCAFAGCGVERRRRDVDAHDAAAALAHARGEREARLALQAATEARFVAQEALNNARFAALEAAPGIRGAWWKRWRTSRSRCSRRDLPRNNGPY